MYKGFLTRTWTLLTAIMVLSVGLNAGVITGNFCAIAPVDNPEAADGSGPGTWADQPVGLNTGANQWFNDLTFVAGYSANTDGTGVASSTGAAPDTTPGSTGANLFYHDQTPAPSDLLISWDSTSLDDHDGRGGTTPAYVVGNRQEQMMAGFLESAGSGGVITLTGLGLDSVYGTDSYSIYLYIDGENGVNGATDVSTWTASDGTTTYYGLDDSDFISGGGTYTRVGSTTLGDYQSGNYVLFEGLTGPGFEITLTGVTNGVVLNAFEIVPEPSSFALLALLGCAGGLIRRRRNA